VWSAVAFAILGAAVIARNVLALSTSPPGLYLDESSIGYNAWAVAHHGVDEHGNPWPLYFPAFGDFKNPVYVYALVPFLKFLPPSAAIERLPAAIFGLIVILFITVAAWRITRSRALALAMFAIAALTPWLIQESRVGFEVVSLVATLSLTLWALAAENRLGHATFAVAGVFLALSIFAYSTGRLQVALFTVVFVAVYARRRFRGWWLLPLIVAAGYAVLGPYAATHPDSVTAEFNLRSIASDGAPVPVLIGRFAANYFSYFDGSFLFVTGDNNLRHNTGFTGMLLAATIPLVLLGVAGCWRRRRDALPKFVVLCLVLGPVAAALVNNNHEPHALRSADMLPFWLLLIAYGLDTARDVLRRWRLMAAPIAGLLAGALVAQAGLYGIDMYTAYPVRAAAYFDTGIPAAIATAWKRAAGHNVFLSTTFEGDAVYIDAELVLQPPPPSKPQPPGTHAQLDAFHINIDNPSAITAAAGPGDTVVLAPSDGLPRGAILVATEYGPTNPLTPEAPAQPRATVYRIASPS
jgi:hypothetical protein